MKANELRIGNIVSYRGETECEVTSVGSNGFESIKLDKYCNVYGSDDVFEYLGVPLTEKWLLKLGFKEASSLMWDGVEFEKEYLGNKFTVDVEMYVYNGCWTQKIKYVHQLQNLYFALTGEELTIKNPDHS